MERRTTGRNDDLANLCTKNKSHLVVDDGLGCLQYVLCEVLDAWLVIRNENVISGRIAFPFGLKAIFRHTYLCRLVSAKFAGSECSSRASQPHDIVRTNSVRTIVS